MRRREDKEPLEALPGGKERAASNLAPRSTPPVNSESRGAIIRNVVVAILAILVLFAIIGLIAAL